MQISLQLREFSQSFPQAIAPGWLERGLENSFKWVIQLRVAKDVGCSQSTLCEN